MSLSVRLPRPTSVKNKTPAPIQITAEQILREAREHHDAAEIQQPLKRQKITDQDELDDYCLLKRKQFEDQVRRFRSDTKTWIKYAQWEGESQKDLRRARSIYERALEVDYRNHSTWIKYAEFEIKNKCINHARNIFDRSVTLLPRVNQLWIKYIHMERILGNFAGVRQILERWMHWMPDKEAWFSYIKFELRFNEIDRAREIFERFVGCHTEVEIWILYAKFEMKNGQIDRCRNVYLRAVDGLADNDEADKLYVAFAEFEELCKEPERARCIYKFAIDHVAKCIYKSNKDRAENLHRKFIAFEKQFGDKEQIDNAIVGLRRFEYEYKVWENPLEYSNWFDYILLEETVGDKERIREVYERAIANVPPADKKKYWKQYIYLWIKYALYEELDAQDMERTRDVYRECLKLITNKKLSFAKIWHLAAKFEIRQLNLQGARKILGNAIGRAPQDKIFKKYIEIELQLGNIDRCRKLYDKYLEWAPENVYAWSKYAELEISLCETQRARSLFELAIAQPALDKPENMWKTYIDFEISQGEFERARDLYERLLKLTKHVKVWISYAKFEASIKETDLEGLEEQKKQCVLRSRRVFEKAIDYYSTSAFPDSKEERAMVLEEWLNMEAGFGDLGDASLVSKKLKKRRQIVTEDGTVGFEEYIDYAFPEEETQITNLKILEAAYKWKKREVCSVEEKVSYED